MTRQVFEKCLDVLTAHPIGTIDITGGAPEMNPHLSWFISEAAHLGRRMLVRSNLAILLEEPYQYEEYMTELINAFNWSALESVMCRTTLPQE